MTPKFRVWDGEKMHSPPHQFYLSSDGVVCWYSHEGPEYDDVGLYTPMLYTGLTDAEGAGIYEGDILEFWGGRREPLRWGGNRYFVVGPGRNNQTAVLENEATVIGNRYENPELLEQNTTPA